MSEAKKRVILFEDLLNILDTMPKQVIYIDYVDKGESKRINTTVEILKSDVRKPDIFNTLFKSPVESFCIRLDDYYMGETLINITLGTIGGKVNEC